IVNVDAGTLGLADDRNLAGQRISPAHAVDLHRIGRAHPAQQKRIARGRVRRQVGFQEIAALAGAAAHPHTGGGEGLDPRAPITVFVVPRVRRWVSDAAIELKACGADSTDLSARQALAMDSPQNTASATEAQPH
ncbi:hypothetical protein E4T56_gene4108, partial [Termitomyces sp. T112]